MTDGIKQAILNGAFLIFSIFLTYLLTTNDEVPNNGETIINGAITGDGHSFNNKGTINQYNLSSTINHP